MKQHQQGRRLFAICAAVLTTAAVVLASVSYQYSIDPVDLEVLRHQIDEAAEITTELESLGASGSNVTIRFAEALDLPEQAALLNIVAAHPLAAAKYYKIGAVNAKTAECMDDGFVYDGAAFSASPAIQLYFVSIVALSNSLAWPVHLPTKAGTVYHIDYSNLPAFQAAACAYSQGIYTQGWFLIEEINACTNVAQVEQIVDPR